MALNLKKATEKKNRADEMIEELERKSTITSTSTYINGLEKANNDANKPEEPVENNESKPAVDSANKEVEVVEPKPIVSPVVEVATPAPAEAVSSVNNTVNDDMDSIFDDSMFLRKKAKNPVGRPRTTVEYQRCSIRVTSDKYRYIEKNYLSREVSFNEFANHAIELYMKELERRNK